MTSAPIMCAPSNSPVLASNTVFTKPSTSPSAIALPLPMKGNLPTLTSWPASLALASVRPTLATCGWQ